MINYDKIKQEYETISQQLSSQDVFQDREKYQYLSKRFAFLEKILAMIKQLQENINAKESLKEVLADPKEEQEVKQLAKEELDDLAKKIEVLEEDIENRLFADQEPERDIIIEIRSAAGGEESALFASSLFKMYSKYIENKKWQLELLSSSPTEIGGLKEVVFSVRGDGAYSSLKFESGVHRVQRVPVTEAGGRLHTSTVTVAVLVEPKEVEINLNPQDIKIDTYRSSGAGGQHVNVTDSAVRMTHLPTGIIVCCQDERSQIKNREKAYRILKARILESMQEQSINKQKQTRRTQIGTGERSEKIRTYNFPERRVTDHRINFSLYRLEAILEGDMEELVRKLLKEERKKIYESQGLV